VVTRSQLVELDQVARAVFQPVPGGDQLAVICCLSRYTPGAGGIVPNSRLDQQLVDFISPLGLSCKVKDAPSVAESAPTALLGSVQHPLQAPKSAYLP